MREINEEVTVNNSKIIEFIDDNEEQKIIVFFEAEKAEVTENVADIIEEKTTIIEDFNGSFEFFVDCSKDRAKIAERLQEWMENPPSCLTAFSSVAKQSMGFSDENSEDKITIVSPICE